jgi:hypothetical protein
MIPYMGCDSVRELLDDFVDGELAIDDQVAVETHLRWCRTCTAHVEDMQVIGSAVRLRAPALHTDSDDLLACAAIPSDVLMRLRAEREQSFTVKVRELFVDRRLLWPALGATIAVFVCIYGVTGVMQLVRAEQPHSLAAMLDLLAHPGSDENPLRLDNHISVPRVIDHGVSFGNLPEDEAVFALATIVNREGRIVGSDLLQWQRSTVLRQASTAQASDVAALLAAVQQSRFTPAQEPGGRAVAVNMVWLIARTTVKGSRRAAIEFELPATGQRRAPAVVKPPRERGVPVGDRSSLQSGSPTA